LRWCGDWDQSMCCLIGSRRHFEECCEVQSQEDVWEEISGKGRLKVEAVEMVEQWYEAVRRDSVFVLHL